MTACASSTWPARSATRTRDQGRPVLRIVGALGTTIWVEIHARPAGDELGGSSGVSGTLVDITTRRVLEERLVQQAFHDDLTGLANRALFRDRVEHALSRRSSVRRHVAVLFVGLDRFKRINESLGHTAGDRLLVAIAERLNTILRPEDTIARLGGDEFGILVEDLQRPEQALELAERLRAAFEEPFQMGKRHVSIRSSTGVVLASGIHQTAEDLLRDADVAMFRAKVSGRGSYALFEPSMQAEVAARLELESDLRDAIEGNGLAIAYQPIVDLADGHTVAVEALARWHHPVRGNVPPLVFIPSAEESGLILALGRWVLRQACQDVADLRRAGGLAADLRLSVNVSARQLDDPNLVDDVLDALRDAGLPPDALDLEVTESLVLDCGEIGIEYLRVLRAAGCKISLDDFGTGFSSLGNLRTMPIDELKIDQSFVGAMLAGGVEAVVAEAVIRLGAALGRLGRRRGRRGRGRRGPPRRARLPVRPGLLLRPARPGRGDRGSAGRPAPSRRRGLSQGSEVRLVHPPAGRRPDHVPAAHPVPCRSGSAVLGENRPRPRPSGWSATGCGPRSRRSAWWRRSGRRCSHPVGTHCACARSTAAPLRRSAAPRPGRRTAGRWRPGPGSSGLVGRPGVRWGAVSAEAWVAPSVVPSGVLSAEPWDCGVAIGVGIGLAVKTGRASRTSQRSASGLGSGRARYHRQRWPPVSPPRTGRRHVVIGP